MRLARLLGLSLVAVFAATAPAAPGDAESLRREVQKALRLRTASERATAIGRAFEGEDSAAAAEVVTDLVFGAEDAQLVIDAAMSAVARMEREEVVGVVRRAADAGPLPRRLAAIEALGRSQCVGATTALLALSADPAEPVRAAALTALGRRDASVLPALETSLSDPAFAVRSAALSSIARLAQRRSVRPVCDALRAAQGRLADDCAITLRALTGQRFGADPVRYETWLAGEESAKTEPGPAYTAPPASFTSPILRTRSRRLLFVLSTSETMKDPVSGAASDADVVKAIRGAGEDLAKDLAAAKTKLDVARVHLRAMLRTLADGVEFDVMSYAGSPAYGFGELTAASASSRKRAEARIASLSPSGPANLHGALLRVFDPRGKDPLAVTSGPDTVILFTDGALAEPGSTDPTEVAMSAVRWNAVRQIKFLVVATGQADDIVTARLAGGPPEGGTASLP